MTRRVPRNWSKSRWLRVELDDRCVGRAAHAEVRRDGAVVEQLRPGEVDDRSPWLRRRGRREELEPGIGRELDPEVGEGPRTAPTVDGQRLGGGRGEVVEHEHADRRVRRDRADRRPGVVVGQDLRRELTGSGAAAGAVLREADAVAVASAVERRGRPEGGAGRDGRNRRRTYRDRRSAAEPAAAPPREPARRSRHRPRARPGRPTRRRGRGRRTGVPTAWPLTWVTTYQDEPDLAVGQVVLHEEPSTVPETVTELAAASFTLIVPLVEADVLRLTPVHAVASAVSVAAAGAGAARLRPARPEQRAACDGLAGSQPARRWEPGQRGPDPKAIRQSGPSAGRAPRLPHTGTARRTATRRPGR